MGQHIECGVHIVRALEKTAPEGGGDGKGCAITSAGPIALPFIVRECCAQLRPGLGQHIEGWLVGRGESGIMQGGGQ